MASNDTTSARQRAQRRAVALARVRRDVVPAEREQRRPISLQGGSADEVPADRAIALLAGRREGTMTRAELLSLGLSSSAIGRRVERGSLTPLFRGVYAVGHAAVGQRGWMRAALLAVGPDAVLSHSTAAYVWQLVDRCACPLEVTVVARKPRPRSGLRVHVTRSLHPLDARRAHRLPVTSPARTLLDLAARLPPDALQRAVTEARVRRLIADGELEDVLIRAPRRHPGARELQRALGAPGAEPVRSELERAFLRLVEDAGLSRPLVNRRRGPHVIDFTWPQHHVVVETDGWAAHGTRHAFEDDRARDAERQAAGFAVLRFTWRQVTEEPLRVTALLARTLTVRT